MSDQLLWQYNFLSPCPCPFFSLCSFLNYFSPFNILMLLKNPLHISSSPLFSFLTVLTSLQWDSVFIRCHPVASVLSKLLVLYGVWADVQAFSTWWDSAVQWRCRQRWLPGHQPGGSICRVQIWLWLWRSNNKVWYYSVCLFSYCSHFLDCFCFMSWSVLQEWRADQSGHVAWAEGFSHSKEWDPPGGQSEVNGGNRWGIWKLCYIVLTRGGQNKFMTNPVTVLTVTSFFWRTCATS